MAAEDQSVTESSLVGRWTYRSFMGNPNIDVDFADLEFGRGELLVEYVCPGKFVGRLIFGDDYQFRLYGIAAPGDPPTIRFRGVGDAADSLNQVYDYFGCLMPVWSYETRQRPTIVGSVVRAVAHNGDQAPAGQAASFIAIKRDAPAEPGPQPAPNGDQESDRDQSKAADESRSSKRSSR